MPVIPFTETKFALGRKIQDNAIGSFGCYAHTVPVSSTAPSVSRAAASTSPTSRETASPPSTLKAPSHFVGYRCRAVALSRYPMAARSGAV